MKEPAFWEDVIQDLPVCFEFRDNYKQILAELQEYLSGPMAFSLFDYPKISVPDVNNSEESVELYKGNSWKITAVGVLPNEKMTAWGGTFIENYVQDKLGLDLHKAIPETRPLLPTISRITAELGELGVLCNAFISILSPGTVIAPHRGDEDLMRVHLGLICDPGCAIVVGDDYRIWQEGELIAFKDGGPYPHSVEHNGTHDRWVLVFDLTLDYLRSVIDHPML